MRIMPNIEEPCSKKSEVLKGVMIPLFGAPLWLEALNVQRNKDRLTTVQRKIVIRIASVYRTASHKTLLG